MKFDIEYIEYLKKEVNNCEKIIKRRKKELEQENDELVREFIKESINDWESARSNFNQLLQSKLNRKV